MKLTKKAKAFLKEADKVAPLLSKECVLCKHHNPNHLILINEEAGYKILCKKCSIPEEKTNIDSVINSVVEKIENSNIEIKPIENLAKIVKKKKVTKPKKEKTVKKSKKTKELSIEPQEPIREKEPQKPVRELENQSTLYSDDNSSHSSLLVKGQWSLAYGQPPKGFKGKVWLAESPDPVPLEVFTDEKGIIHEIYYFEI